MKLKNLVGERFKENPSDCVVDSHAIMIRGGYIKYVANGIYSSYTPLIKIIQKVEQIIRHEMDLIDGQEVQFPITLPASLWQESGRYDSIGSELLRFNDRNNSPFVLGMTHEEAAVHLVKDYANSYTKYPFMIYQFQTKFRDEARPRARLIRVREFTMKDAYSFHTNQNDLEEYYYKCYHAYENIFKRVGLPQVIPVSSDSGMMGGNISHEFMLLTPCGEDSIALCTNCNYRSNVEAAPTTILNQPDEIDMDLSLIHTPGFTTIEDVTNYLSVQKEKMCKAIVYQKNEDNQFVIVFIRGDLEVNETKLTNYLRCDIHPAAITESSNLIAGYIGPYNLAAVSSIVLFDNSLKNTNNLVCGANQLDYHYTGLNIKRDIGDVEYHDFSKIPEGGICPHCGKPTITISRGIEVGNIFQLGTKYTKSMHMNYIDQDGKTNFPFMGCYGIGIGRLVASICEAHHDSHGPIWPISIAPWQIHICAIRYDQQNVCLTADKLYSQLCKNGIEVIYDNRSVSAGVMFSDADLLGIPIRVIISPRNVEQNIVEIITRDKSFSKLVPLDNAVDELLNLITDQQKNFGSNHQIL